MTVPYACDCLWYIFSLTIVQANSVTMNGGGADWNIDYAIVLSIRNGIVQRHILQQDVSDCGELCDDMIYARV